MAAEARAMLDALMGADRNAEIPQSGGSNSLQRRKKSCYDHDICPLFCAWGVDVYELFTNTKSDIGPNPKVVQDSAREEYLSLPDHERDRLGFEFMLYRKLSDMVRGCDRIVNRNKEKLRLEIARAARARGAAGRPIDPASDVSEEMVLEAAEIMADLEIREEEVSVMLERLMELDSEWKGSWEELKCVHGENSNSDDDHNNKIRDDNNNNGEQSTMNTEEPKSVKLYDDEKNDEKKKEDDIHQGEKDADTDKSDNEKDTDNNDAEKNNQHNYKASSSTTTTFNEKNQNQEGEDKQQNKDERIKELKSKLYKLSSEQQKLISSISILTSQTIVPLRDKLQNLNKQLYYVKTDTSSDKTVCEVSGNFMSSRDAEERIAAHYAGKQYVGWKMVRDKVRELHKKYAHGPPRGGGAGGPPPGYGGGRGGGGYGQYGGPPPGHGNWGSRGGGYGRGPPPPGYGGGRGGGRYGGYGGGPPPNNFNRNRRDRSRSRDRGDGPSRSRNQRRRSPSPQGRWQRDRGFGGGRW